MLKTCSRWSKVTPPTVPSVLVRRVRSSSWKSTSAPSRKRFSRAGEQAIELDGRERQLVVEVPEHDVVAKPQASLCAHRVLQHRADLLLGDGLAGIEAQIQRRRLLPVGGGFRRGEAAGVVGDRGIHRVEQQRELRTGAEFVSELRCEQRALGGGVVAEAFEGRARKMQAVVHRQTGAPEGTGAGFEEAVAAGVTAGTGLRQAAALAGVEAQHAAGGRAVERGRRTAQDFDAFGGAEVKGVQARLPVGQRRRHVVDENADAADAEVRSRAEAADGNAQVLGEVVAVQGKHARHRGKGLVKTDLLASVADARLGKHRRGPREAVPGRFHAR